MHPKLVPQMAGAEEVFAALPATTASTYAEPRAQPQGARARAGRRRTNEIHVAYPVTDTFAQRNQNTTVEEAARDRRGDHRARTDAEGHGDDLASRSAARSRATSIPGVVIEHAAPHGGGRARTR